MNKKKLRAKLPLRHMTLRCLVPPQLGGVNGGMEGDGDTEDEDGWRRKPYMATQYCSITCLAYTCIPTDGCKRE